MGDRLKQLLTLHGETHSDSYIQSAGFALPEVAFVGSW
jgi:hypothetical protein